MDKQEIINELSRLYALQAEGKHLKSAIQDLEQKLWEVCDDELDQAKANEKDQKKRKEVKHG